MSEALIPVETYPLAWPKGWARTPPHERQYSRFQVLGTGARESLAHQIRILDGQNLILSTNLKPTRSGTQYGARPNPTDPGVAAYWQQRVNGKLQWRVVACDRWKAVAENMRAISLTLEAMRGLGRWGANDMLTRAFAGFAALPNNVLRGSKITLGVSSGASLGEVEDASTNLSETPYLDVPYGAACAANSLTKAIRKTRTELNAGSNERQATNRLLFYGPEAYVPLQEHPTGNLKKTRNQEPMAPQHAEQDRKEHAHEQSPQETPLVPQPR